MSQIGPHRLSQVNLRPLSELLGAPAMPAAQAPAKPAQVPSLPTLPLDQRLPSPLATSSAQTQLSFLPSPLIGPNDRVLHIGDSHTAGIYGQTMDKLLRSTGAKVETVGSSSSRPSWYLDGTPTKWGFYSKDEEGHVDAPANWKEPHPTPTLPNLINKMHPNVIMISLGANLLYAKGETIEKEVRNLADIAKASGARIIWVGPPDGAEAKKPTSKQDFLYEHLQKIAGQYGDFIDSRPLTEYPIDAHGKPLGDGVHYTGTTGGKIAREWTQAVFNQIQALKK